MWKTSSRIWTLVADFISNDDKRASLDIWSVFKKFWDLSCVYQDRNKQCEWNIDFLQNSAFGFQLIYFSEFSIDCSTSETPPHPMRWIFSLGKKKELDKSWC